ncbi:DNA-methyltransferase [Candidatus Poriferisodalis sp.]|uniref:DNA-methyltransferase n=1 Tax=Candidatus Poriferisodalis sp. TaxID=3101277 RepID=UPI003B01BB2B
MKRTETSSFGTGSRVGHDASKFYGQRMYQGIGVTSPDDALEPNNAPDQLDVIHLGDSRDMKQLPGRSVHLMVTSPPYNVGKDYDDDLTLNEYSELLAGVLNEVYRVLVYGGRACINIANVGRTPYIPLHMYIGEIAQECGFLMRGEIIWDKGVSAGTSCAWGSWMSASNPVLRDVHEYILVFSKESYRRHPVQEDSIGRDEFLEQTKSIWRFPSASARRAQHPAPFPVELPLRLMHLYSYVDDIVLDPFMGSGTTAEAALMVGRHYVGYEINEQYVEVAKNRLASMDTTLKLL